LCADRPCRQTPLRERWARDEDDPSPARDRSADRQLSGSTRRCRSAAICWSSTRRRWSTCRRCELYCVRSGRRRRCSSSAMSISSPRSGRGRCARKCRGDGAPLILPLLARTEEQTAAKKRAQDAHGGCRPDIIPGVVNHDSANRARSAGNELTIAEKPMDDDIVFKRLGGNVLGHCRVAPDQGSPRVHGVAT
jgi:hypothetical protein